MDVSGFLASSSLNTDIIFIEMKTVTHSQKSLGSSTITETVAAILISNTLTDAAKRLGISRSSLYERINRYDLKKSLDPFIEQATYSLKIASIKAAEELVNQLDNSNIYIRAEAAKGILDRIGITKK